MKKQVLFFVLAAVFCLSAIPNSFAQSCGIQTMGVVCCTPVQGKECPDPSPTPPAPNQSSDGIVSAKAEAVIAPKTRGFFEYFFDLFA